MATNPEVLISEVGPRDGLQSIRTVMPTERKIAWLDALAACGLREIEVGSFVPARLLPQMADTEVLVRHGLRWPDITVVALVPNVHGARAALAAGAHKLTVPVSASEAHSMANVRKTCAQMVVEVKQIIALRDTLAPGARVEVGLSTAFGCTLQGEVPEDQVLRLAEALAGRVGVAEGVATAPGLVARHGGLALRDRATGQGGAETKPGGCTEQAATSGHGQGQVQGRRGRAARPVAHRDNQQVKCCGATYIIRAPGARASAQRGLRGPALRPRWQAIAGHGSGPDSHPRPRSRPPAHRLGDGGA
jgi:hypothetical protein